MRGKKDQRLPLTAMGLGLWTDSRAKFYLVDLIKDQGGALIDNLDGGGLVVLIGPNTGIPIAFWTIATSFQWEGDSLVLSSGESVRAGDLYDSAGQLVTHARPHQMFTRWYGFAYTFPGCDIMTLDS